MGFWSTLTEDEDKRNEIKTFASNSPKCENKVLGGGSVKYVKQDKYNVVVKNAMKSKIFFTLKNFIKWHIKFKFINFIRYMSVQKKIAGKQNRLLVSEPNWNWNPFLPN